MKHYSTLVQHSAWIFASKPGFRQAVEPAMITEKQATRVLEAGGVVIEPSRVYDAEHAVNYPPEVKGIYPAARGTFHKRLEVDGAPVYLPASTEDIIGKVSVPKA